MPIEALPAITVRAIGSSQSLTDPASVVKELVDNAIDAQATSISVEIAVNTLDKILVTDNGHGIAIDDRRMLGTRYCTSKIRSFEDLQSIGGRSLGFRGEALASAAEMAGELKLTTRVEGEETAMEYAYSSKGNILGYALSYTVAGFAHLISEKRVSHPAGTTVSISHFLKNLPVRKEIALKEKPSASQLGKIKHKLHAYALVRPHIRFSLKVLKARTERSNWSYVPNCEALHASPTAAPTVQAATTLFGRKFIDQCAHFTWTSSGKEPTIEPLTPNSPARVTTDESYRFQALLPKAGTVDFSAVLTPRQFISIDARPISCSRGTAKHIVSRFKKSFRTAASGNDIDKSVDPFICLNIMCPPESYDANVEPAKDLVLFDNLELVLSLADNFFRAFYGNPTTGGQSCTSRLAMPKTTWPDSLAKGQSNSSAAPRVQHGQETRAVGCNGSRTSKSPEHLSSGATLYPEKISDVAFEQQRLRYERLCKRGSMYDESEEDAYQANEASDDPFSDTVGQNLDSEDAVDDITISNPWAIAKFNACLRRPSTRLAVAAEKDIIGQLPTPERQRGDISTSPSSPCDGSRRIHNYRSQGLLAPERPERRPSVNTDMSSPPPFPFPLKARAKQQAREECRPSISDDKVRLCNGALDTWLQRSLNRHGKGSQFGRGDHRIDNDGGNRPPASSFIPAQTLSTGTTLRNIANMTQESQQQAGARKGIEKFLPEPFITSSNDSGSVSFEIGECRPRTQQQHLHAPNASNTFAVDSIDFGDKDSNISVVSSTPASQRHPDLTITMEYEARKQKAIQTYRDHERRQALEHQKASHRETNVGDDPWMTTPPSSSPCKNRYLKAINALQRPRNALEAATGGIQRFEVGDPRAFLMRKQAREAAATNEAQHNGKARMSKRARTALLLLETTPKEGCVRELLLRLESTKEDIAADMQTLAMWDEYIANGTIPEALSDPSIHDLALWEGKLEQLVTKQYAPEGTPIRKLAKEDLGIDLRAALAAYGKT
ncbi:MAG: hypothetical protein Q9163_001985 [Psora crenata]